MGALQRAVCFVAVAAAALATGASTLAYTPTDPADPALPYVPWRYASQLAYGPFEDGTATFAGTPSAQAFLTLPFLGSHLVTSIFDHCNPDYIPDGRVCRYDGAVALASRGADWRGYPRSKGAKDYLYYDGHDGMDYSLYYEPVLAAAPGKVVKAGWDVPGCDTCGFGQTVLIDHGNGFTTRYGHLSRVGVSVGQSVLRGQALGVSGNTGASTGEHLHFGVYRTFGMIPIDPYGWSGPRGADPWRYDEGDLWIGGAPRFPAGEPAAVQASASFGPGGVRVSWGGAGAEGSYSVMVALDSGALEPWLRGVPAGSAVYPAVPGRSYWFLVQGTTSLGWRGSAMTDQVTAPAPGSTGHLAAEREGVRSS